MRAITLSVPRKLVEAFKKRARDQFPKELYAVLIGHDYHDKIEVLDFFYPNFKSNRFFVWCDDQGYIEAVEHAAELELTIVGDIHSHCYAHNVGADHSKSEIDHAWGHKLTIQGICRVLEFPSGLRRATVKFWGPTIPVESRLEPSHRVKQA